MNKITTTSAAALMALTLFGIVQPIVSHADQINNTPVTHQNNIQNKADTDVVTIPDANLKEAVKTALGVTDDKDITVGAMKGTWLNQLDISKAVTTFSGMENATGLEEMKIEPNLVGMGAIDFTPLEQITFNYFDIAGADISQEQFNHIHFNKTVTAAYFQAFGNPTGTNHIYDLTSLSGITSFAYKNFKGQTLIEPTQTASGGNLTLKVKDIKNIDGSVPSITVNDGGILSSDGETITWSGIADTVTSVSYTWLATNGFSGTVTVPLTSKQEDVSKDVQVSYDYTAPTPADPTWYSVVPKAVTFTDANKEVDTSVKLVNADDQKTPYSGTKSVDVTVKSDNGYKLKDTAGNTVDYKLDKDGKNTTFFDANNTAQELGCLDKDHASIASKAHLTGTATKTGKYIDTLHYVFAETD